MTFVLYYWGTGAVGVCLGAYLGWFSDDSPGDLFGPLLTSMLFMPPLVLVAAVATAAKQLGERRTEARKLALLERKLAIKEQERLLRDAGLEF